jgi:hypothetical protein
MSRVQMLLVLDVSGGVSDPLRFAERWRAMNPHIPISNDGLQVASLKLR